MRYGFILVLLGLGLSVAAKAQVTDSTRTILDESIDSTLTSQGQRMDSTQTGRKITLQEAINIAIKNNYQLKQAGNNLDLASAQILGAKADFLPSVNGRLSGQKTVGQQFVQTTVSFSNVTTNSISGGLTASLPIFSGFRNIINLRRSHINEDYEQATKQRTRQTVIFNTVSGFLQIVLNEQLLNISRQNLKSSKRQLEQVKAQVNVGSVASVDQYNQEATVASNELNVIQQENALSYSETQLLGTLQLDPEKEYNFVAPDINDFDLTPTTLSLSNLIDQALANRKDLQAQKLLIERNHKDLGLTRANYFPSISASAGINSQYNDNYRTGPQRQTIVGFSEQFFTQNVNKFLGISVDIPIFNNLTTRLNVEQSKINYKNSELQYENLKYNALDEVRQAYNDYRSYKEQLKSSAKALKAAKRSFETQQERYKVGAGSLIEFSDANAQYVQAESDRAQAVLRFIFQKKLLDFYLGKIDKDISFPR